MSNTKSAKSSNVNIYIDLKLITQFFTQETSQYNICLFIFAVLGKLLLRDDRVNGHCIIWGRSNELEGGSEGGNPPWLFFVIYNNILSIIQLIFVYRK